MKLLFIFASFLLSVSSSAQRNKLKVGDRWPYSNAYMRTTPDSAQLLEFHYFDGLAKVKYNNQVGFIDSSKTIVIPLIYEDDLGANRFSNSRSIVVKKGYWGVIDSSGETVIPFKYGKIRERDQLYCVYEDEGYAWGYLDEYGNIVLPLYEYGQSSVMTKEEVNELAKKHAKKVRLEKSTSISKEKAISIAKRKKCYWQEEFPFSSSVELDSTSNQWIIRSWRDDGVTYKGYCAKTNGCTVVKQALIVIDASSGKVLKKSIYRKKIANYE